MSVEHATGPPGKWKTVQPVGPSSYSATPISSPGKSKRSSGPSKLVCGTSSAVSFERRAIGAWNQEVRAARPATISESTEVSAATSAR